MIPDQWYAILEAQEVKPGRPVGVTRLGEKLVVWRSARGELSCLADLCPHRGAALSQGPVQGDHLACPFHGFEYDVTGRGRGIPANGRRRPVPSAFTVKAYPVREAHGFIWLWWGAPRPELPPIPFFDDIDASFSCLGYSDPWPVHYSRAIENQLDVVHLPFVHHNTIGRGHRTVVDGPLARLENDRLLIWVYNRKDDGVPARKPAQLPPPTRPPFLEFIFPHLWQNRISPDMRIVVAFTPVDETHTVLYLRFYQRFMRWPGLRQLVDWGSRLSGKVILNQDKRVVLAQRPVKSELGMPEVLIQGDYPIFLYRRRRHELINLPPAGS